MKRPIESKVFIDSSCDILYASFYIHGLFSLFGKRNVNFSSKYFSEFKHDNHFFAFVIINSNGIKKIVIDFTDSSKIALKPLDWCHVYGKINYDQKISNSNKIIPIGPSFGIRVFNFQKTFIFAISNYIKSFNRVPNVTRFFADYKRMFTRPKLSDFESLEHVSKTNYIFFISSLWKNEPLTNGFRANFIKSCKSIPFITFEGGFAPRTKNDISGFETLTTLSRISMDEYIENTKKSSFVFNTPAVKSCHGWKLAEFMCLGKAIISTPLSREMPEEFVDKKHVLFTDGTQTDLNEKIEFLFSNLVFRSSLEAEVKNYFANYLSPVSVIRTLNKF